MENWYLEECFKQGLHGQRHEVSDCQQWVKKLDLYPLHNPDQRASSAEHFSGCELQIKICVYVCLLI